MAQEVEQSGFATAAQSEDPGDLSRNEGGFSHVWLGLTRLPRPLLRFEASLRQLMPPASAEDGHARGLIDPLDGHRLHALAHPSGTSCGSGSFCGDEDRLDPARDTARTFS